MRFDAILDSNKQILSNGSVFELLRRSPDVTFDDHIAHGGLIYDEASANVLAEVLRSYIDIAVSARLPISIETATWRANKERIRASTFSNRSVNEDNVKFLENIRDSYAGSRALILITGSIGPRGDAYKPEEALDSQESQSFHQYQIDALASSGVDYLGAFTLPALSEAMGIALAMEKTKLPYVISFVVNRSGCLLDGTRLAEAIFRIDDVVGNGSARYSVNCVHPSILYQALEKNPEIEGRIFSFHGNTSDLSTDELDGIEHLDTQEPHAFAAAHQQLLQDHEIKIVGACCGSSPDHVREIAELLGHVSG
jgi:homocysteine S-methyltransferase